MLKSIVNFIKMPFTNSSPDTAEDIFEIDKAIKIEHSRLKTFYKIVGQEPMSQIDWIIENGFTKFNQLYRDIMNGTYQEKKSDISLTFKQNSPTVSYIRMTSNIGYLNGSIEEKIKLHCNAGGDGIYTETLRGGTGNRVIYSYTVNGNK